VVCVNDRQAHVVGSVRIYHGVVKSWVCCKLDIGRIASRIGRRLAGRGGL
jgi:hypothetical protein